VAPVPIFALGKPAILGSAILRKGKFYFNPEFNLGVDFKPWTIFSRVGYYLVEQRKLTIGITANTNWFFQQNKPIVNDLEYQVQQYYSFEFNGEYRPKDNQRFIFAYWRSDRLSKAGVLFENFINFVYCFDNIKFGNKNIINTRPSFFLPRRPRMGKRIFHSTNHHLSERKLEMQCISNYFVANYKYARYRIYLEHWSEYSILILYLPTTLYFKALFSINSSK